MILLVLFLVNFLGMLYGVVIFVGTCSGDKMECVSGVSVFEVLEGEGYVFREFRWGGGGDKWFGLGMSKCFVCRGRGVG